MDSLSFIIRPFPDWGRKMHDQVDLTVVIVTYKARRFILPCLQSLDKATEGMRIEVIVIDNGSDDGLADFISNKFPEVKVTENEENIGFSRAVNQGANLAKGHYLCILNPDTRLFSDTLKILVTFLETNPSAHVVTPRMFDLEGKNIPSCRSLPHIGNIARYLVAMLLQGKQLKKPRSHLLDLWDQNQRIDLTKYKGYVTGGCFVTRLAFFKEMGMFDDRFFLFYEDADFGFRMLQRGYSGVLVSEASMIHLGGWGTIQNPRWKLFAVKSCLYFIRKNFTFLHGVVCRQALSFLVLAWTLGAWLKGRKDQLVILRQMLKCCLSCSSSFVSPSGEPHPERTVVTGEMNHL
jgi:O-antigen biosynthesis protein